MKYMSVEAAWKKPADCRIFFDWEDRRELARMLKPRHKKLAALVETLYKRNHFIPKRFESIVGTLHEAGKLEIVILVGLGKSADVTPDIMGRAAAVGARRAEQMNLESVAVFLPDAQALAQAARWLMLGLYHFDRFKKREEPSRAVKEITLTANGARDNASGHLVHEGEIIGRAINTVRHLGNLPAADLTPEKLAQEAKALEKISKTITVQVLDEVAMKKVGMGALLGVAKGSREKSKFVVIKYQPGGATIKPLVMIGKGVTFDTGGISLKPRERMHEMKFDMTGAGAVIGAIRAIAELGLRVNVVGLIPAVENMPSGSALKPGDILTAMNGHTIEVQDTDAEGRLILADALCYAAKYFQPTAVIDLATLTGACVIALGSQVAGLMGNDDVLIEEVKQAALNSGDAVWPLPLNFEFREQVKSDVADVKNVGAPLGEAATIAGGAFLSEFARGLKWAHLDIAGPAYTLETKPYLDKGATGFGTHLLVELAKKYINGREERSKK